MNQKDSVEIPYHPESPAGVYWSDNYSSRSLDLLELHDPHFKKGGFGSSTAEFISLALMHEYLTKSKCELSSQTIWKIHEDYKRTCSPSNPSGADLVAQLKGGLVRVELEKKEIENLNWPSSFGGFSIFKTPLVTKTHVHLKIVKPPFPSLNNLVEKGIMELRNQNWQGWQFVIRQYEIALRSLNLRTDEVIPYIDSFNQNQKWSAKGCGALGADVVLVSHPKEDRDSVLQMGKELGLKFIVDEQGDSLGSNIVIKPDSVGEMIHDSLT